LAKKAKESFANGDFSKFKSNFKLAKQNELDYTKTRQWRSEMNWELGNIDEKLTGSIGSKFIFFKSKKKNELLLTKPCTVEN
jgi:hypothetical protein